MNAGDTAAQDVPVLRALRHHAALGWKRIRVALRFHGKGTFPNFPIPVRLPFGAWWLAWNDVVGKTVLKGSFDKAESDFLAKFLKPGMTALDVGAHHGYYTLLASGRVGSSGRVFAFEPSPRERKKLRWHLRWNHCLNVEVLDTALGAHPGQAELFLAAGRETGCNSLRPPAVRGIPRKVGVPVDTLDNFLSSRNVEHVDFLKLDVEGAELSVLAGAEHLLAAVPRPVLLVEICDQRTVAWGYGASEILKQLSDHGYRWFEPRDGGWISPAVLQKESYDENLVGIPEERISQFREFWTQAQNVPNSGPGALKDTDAV